MMDSYRSLEVTGPISVNVVPANFPGLSRENNPSIILLLGPTGSGKSSFIECIANDNTLGIAKDQLDGVTQMLSIYQIQNVSIVEDDSPLYIVDTPGFADSKIPESKTMRLVIDFVRERNININRIFYFDRITDSRMAGSKGKLLDLFSEMTGQSTGFCVTFITTMWDRIWKEEQLRKANTRLEEMQGIYFKEFVQDQARVMKFENTHESAIYILDRQDFEDNHDIDFFSFERVAWGMVGMPDTNFAKSLHQNLLERKAALWQNLMMIENELTHELAHPHPQLRGVLLRQKEEMMIDIAVVEDELKEFPPLETPAIEAPSTSHNIVSFQETTSSTKQHAAPRLANRMLSLDVAPPPQGQRAMSRFGSASSSEIPRPGSAPPSSAPPQSSPFKATLSRGKDRFKGFFSPKK
ncbi:hypothetical protein BJ165DRAFT_772845 [Panaeolus papilionaceus]|nr:hypothetical protein BJ165DRAFT_772845 [Panaeolus papilionaceus]